MIAGFIIVQEGNGRLRHFDTLGYVVIGVMIICAWLMYVISSRIAKKMEVHTTVLNEAVV
jgi:hypothetical protein